IKVSNIRLELDEPEQTLPGKIASRLAVSTDSILGWRIIRKSLDARGHDDVHFAYSAAVELSDSDSKRVLESSVPLAEAYDPERFWWPDPGFEPLDHRPVIIGAGPAGLFAGYLLARSGYQPLILERGRAVKDRVADVRRFDQHGPLDPESNYLFGE